MSTLPAILGGRPSRTKPYPVPNFIGSEERRLVAEVLDSGVLSNFVAHHGPQFNGGRMVQTLEAEFCDHFGVRFAVSVNSATSGLHCALAAALVGLGHEVIVPPYTMSATATTVAQLNATPVFADIDPRTFCLDVEDVRRKVSSRTRAIVAVNLFGAPASLHELRSLADKQGIVLIEDNAQAPGAKLRGDWTGTVGHLGVFSLNCHKTIQCGEGGVVVTSDSQFSDRLRLVRNHGEVVQSQRATVEPELEGLLGSNYRLTELQAAVGLAQVRRLEELTENRIAMANVMSARLREIPGITPPFVSEQTRHVYYLYAFKLDAHRVGLSRNQFKTALDAEGVSCSAGYVKPLYLYPMYASSVANRREGFGAGIWHPHSGSSVCYERGICPVTERMYDTELLLTNICRADLDERDALEFARAVEKIFEHRSPIRDKLFADGIE